MAKIDCEYCARFDKEQLKAIQEYDEHETPNSDTNDGGDLPF
jgi:hypothetical protein